MVRTKVALVWGIALIGLLSVMAYITLERSGNVTEWSVPKWRAGDLVEVASGPDPEAPRFRFQQVLDGPHPVLNERGEAREGFRWLDPETGDPIVPTVFYGLKEGRGLQSPDPFAGRAVGAPVVRIVFGPREAGSQGVALQGLVLREGLSFSVPNGWSGDATEFRVTSITPDRATVEATVSYEWRVPFWRDSTLHVHSVNRYLITYEQESPYPTEIRVFQRTNDTAEERLSNVIRFTILELIVTRIIDRGFLDGSSFVFLLEPRHPGTTL